MEPKDILILGAGRSSSTLITYLLQRAHQHHWTITVGDVSVAQATERIGGFAQGKAIEFNIENEEESRKIIQSNHLVVSLLPAHLHVKAATLCLEEGKHFLTASYESSEMRMLDKRAKEKDLLFLNECGLDPGIDHMSGMQLIDRIKSQGGVLTSFESFTGGLIAPDTDPENPWRYKFTWNPRNVVMAGQGTAKFLQEGQFKFIPYQKIFARTTQVEVPGFGDYEGYANRDSLKYLGTYGLHGIKTMLRGTLRNKGFCQAWNILVQLGCCEDTYLMEAVNTMSHREFLNSFLAYHPSHSVEEKVCDVFNLTPASDAITMLHWSGFFSDELIGLSKGTPAQILEHILSKRWKLKPGDKDLVVMWHRFRFLKDGVQKEIQAHLTATGENEINTAMAKTVGLPLAVAARLLLEGKIKARGVVIPVLKEIYDPVLQELQEFNIRFIERES